MKSGRSIECEVTYVGTRISCLQILLYDLKDGSRILGFELSIVVVIREDFISKGVLASSFLVLSLSG